LSRPAGSSKLLRVMNESAAFAHLLDPGHLTRADLRRLTALSTPTISEVLRRLTVAGLISVVGYNSGRPGPNAEIYSAKPDAAWTAAISVRDIGASHAPSLAASVSDLTGAVRARVEARVDFLHTDPVDAIADVVAQLRAETGAPADRIRQVQLGVAGSYDARSEIIHHVEVPGFGRTGLVPEIAARLGTRVDVDNDVNLAAVAERRRGVGREADGFALLWLGADGLGLAIDIGGTLMRGARGGAGEIGYMPLYAPDSASHSKIALQDLVGGSAVLTLAGDHGIPGATPPEAVTAAAADPTRHAAFFTQLADRVSVGLAAVIAVLDPTMVVLAGEVAQAGGEPLREAVAAAMGRNAPLQATIELTSLQDDAVLQGAQDAGLTTIRETLLAQIADT
jgi:predicted NBD/HSP70 family sugar kinase